MKALILREFKSFFGSTIGYLVLSIFLLVNGLFLWVIEGDFNILISGYNDLTPFFKFSPWVLLLLVPAVTMRSFSDEKKLGTLELLVTKPLSMSDIVLGKFFGAMLLIFIAILPTFAYLFLLNSYGMPNQSIDLASTIGSYIGLFFLAAAYTSIGVFSSTLSENQIVCLLVAMGLCILFYFGFDQFALFIHSPFLSKLGMQDHFESLSKGVIDTRDLIYFVSVVFIFIQATIYSLKKQRN